MTTPENQPEGSWLPCPFCGSTNVGLPFNDRPCSWATCNNCEADGPLMRVPSNLHAYLAWNRRQPSALQCKNIPDRPILEMLAKNPSQGHTWHGTERNVADAMPAGVPPKLALAKMRMMLRRGVVDGCACGCRGDFTITAKGLAEITKEFMSEQTELTSEPRKVSSENDQAQRPALGESEQHAK